MFNKKILFFRGIGKVESINFPLDTHNEIIHHGESHIIGSYENINEKKKEVFPVPKSYTVVDPGTVVVHI